MSHDEDTAIADVLFDARLLSSMIEACEDRTQLMLSQSFWSIAAELACSIKTLDDLSEPRVIQSACPGAGLRRVIDGTHEYGDTSDPWALLSTLLIYVNHRGGMAIEDPRPAVREALKWRRNNE